MGKNCEQSYWDRLKAHFAARSKRYHEWRMQHYKVKTNSNYYIYYHEIGVLFGVFLIFALAFFLILAVILYRPEWIEWWVRRAMSG